MILTITFKIEMLFKISTLQRMYTIEEYVYYVGLLNEENKTHI